MIVTKKFLSRRTFLRGAGAVVALPLLDAMVPALSALTKTAGKPFSRFGVFYTPNGAIMEQWTPALEGAAFEFSPTLEPFAPFRDRMLVLTGLDCRQAEALGDGGGDHTRSAAAFLTGVHPRKSETDIKAGISIDQIAARELGTDTQLASLELAGEAMDFIGACDVGYSCAYSSTISWRTPTTPLPADANPRVVFERLFGGSGSTDPAARLARIRENRSILDSVSENVARLRNDLGPSDRTTFGAYLDAVRDVERRIQVAERQSDRELPVVQRPTGIPPNWEDHIKLLFDLQVLAYQSDLTRVATFLLAKESGANVYPASGVSDAHHSVTHHAGDPVKIAKTARINHYHATAFAYFLEKLRSTPDGDGTLLDHSMVLYGGGMSNGDLHTHDNVPLLVFGGGAGTLAGGRHIRYPKGTPLSNLHVSLLDKLGVRVENFGDSTGTLEFLSGV